VKVAVTGASGFIGRHVLAELSRNQVEVVAVTRSANRLQKVSPEITVVVMDISTPASDCFARMGHPDVLIHLAWDGLPHYNLLHHFESELPKQYQFLKTMVDTGLPALFVAGTCLEYGMQSGALSEVDKPCPNNPYGYAKDMLRQQLEFLRSTTPFKLTWGRLFYMYGEGQPDSSLYPLLKNAVLRGELAFKMSGGEQLRDYLPVTEVARRIVQLVLLGNDIGTVNICSGKPVSVRRLVEQWLSENNWEMQLNLGHYPYPDYEPMAFWGDATKLQEVLGASSES
jgi:dTDP-6-deoxy-L-talose 4-dehydrogenase (NAD+)